MAALYELRVRDAEDGPTRPMQPEDLEREVTWMQAFVARHLRQALPWVEELTLGELRGWHEHARSMVLMEMGAKDPFTKTPNE